MSLQILPDLEQGSPEWHDQRRGMVTASVVGKLITAKTVKVASNDESRGLTTLLTAERITGYTEPTFTSSDMLRGIYDEPIARNLYSQHYAPVTQVGFMVRTIDGFRLGFSPDGLVGDDGLLEIKSRNQKVQLATITGDAVPLANIAQLQAGLLVSGREWIDYLSFSAGMPAWVRRVYPNQKWFDAITSALHEFEKNSKQMIDTYTQAPKGPDTERVIEMDMVI